LKIILTGLVVLMVAGCGLPLTYLRYGFTAYDAHQIVNDDPTITKRCVPARWKKMKTTTLMLAVTAVACVLFFNNIW